MTTTSQSDSPDGAADKRSTAAVDDAASEIRFSMSAISPESLRQAISAVPLSGSDENLIEIQISDANGQHAALMRLDHPVRIHVDGPLGDYAFAFNAEADVRLTGSVGHGVAEGMISGAVRIRGDAATGAGAAMRGGTLAIYGSAGDRCGAGMRRGGIFVRGNVGDDTGVGALGGTIVIGGDAGEHLGDAMNNVTVFIRGQAKSLAPGVTEAPLRKREQLRLGLLLINASIRGDAKEFRRIVPEAMLKAEESQRGEIVPNWR
jgi:glutamate synthase domain-containing protein 3